MHIYGGKLLKLARKGQYEKASEYISMVFSWAMALANKFNIAMADKINEFFPGVCPYCQQKPCSCGTRAITRQPITTQQMNFEKPESIGQFQKMFVSIYPHGQRKEDMMLVSAHLLEEICEVDEALQNFHSTSRNVFQEEIITELVDVVANLFAVATCYNMSLADEMFRYFSDGCHICKHLPCQCGYVSTKAKPIL